MDENLVEFDIVFEPKGRVNINPLNDYTKELFECLIESEIQELLKPFINYAMTGYIKYLIKRRLLHYLDYGF